MTVNSMGLANMMLWLKENMEELVQEQVALRQEQEELQNNNEQLFDKIKWGKAVEAPAADDCRTITWLDEEMWAASEGDVGGGQGLHDRKYGAIVPGVGHKAVAVCRKG